MKIDLEGSVGAGLEEEIARIAFYLHRCNQIAGTQRCCFIFQMSNIIHGGDLIGRSFLNFGTPAHQRGLDILLPSSKPTLTILWPDNTNNGQVIISSSISEQPNV